MTPKGQGWTIFIAALGMMCGLLYIDVSKLTTWNEAVQPAFIAQVMLHFSTVTIAFIGGRLIPTNSDSSK